MSSHLLLLLLLVALAAGEKAVTGDRYLLVFSDVVFRGYRHYVAAFKPLGSPPLTVRLSLTDDGSEKQWLTESVALKSSDSFGLLSFSLPSSFPASALRVRVSATWKKGAATNHNVTLAVAQQPFPGLLMIERRLMRPGGNLRFRTVSLPILGESIFTSAPPAISTVFLLDPSGRRVAEWRGTSTKGVLSHRLPWQESNGRWRESEGRWRVCGEAAGAVRCQSVEVRAGAPTRADFLVRPRPPRFLRVDDDRVEFEVCVDAASEKLRGRVNASLCLGARCVKALRVRAELTGCMSFIESTAALALKTAALPGPRLTLTVRVTEQASQETVTESVRGPRLLTQPFRLVADVPAVFQPGLPLLGRVRAVGPDQEPVTNLTLLLSAPDLPLHHRSTLVTDNTGQAAVRLAPFPASLRTVRVRLQAVKHPLLSPDPRMPTPQLLLVLNRSADNGTFMSADWQRPGADCRKVFIRLRTTTPISDITVNAVAVSRANISRIDALGEGVKQTPCEDSDDDAVGHFTCAGREGGDYRVKCRPGWRGDNCLTPICSDGCVRGLCQAPDRCLCDRGWTGKACEVCSPKPGCSHGFCHHGNDCNCQAKWSGPLCNVANASATAASSLTPISRLPVPPASRPPPTERLTIFTRYEPLELDPSFAPAVSLVLWFEHSVENRTEIVFSHLGLSSLTSCLSPRVLPILRFSPRRAQSGQQVTVSLHGADGDECALLRRPRFAAWSLEVLAAEMGRRLMLEGCLAGAWPPALLLLSSRERRQQTSAAEVAPLGVAVFGWRHEDVLLRPGQSANLTAPREVGKWRLDAVCFSSAAGLRPALPAFLQVTPAPRALSLGLPDRLEVGVAAVLPLTVSLNVLGFHRCRSFVVAVNDSAGILVGWRQTVQRCSAGSETFRLPVNASEPGVLTLHVSVRSLRLKEKVDPLAVEGEWRVDVVQPSRTLAMEGRGHSRCQKGGFSDVFVDFPRDKLQFDLTQIVLSGELVARPVDFAVMGVVARSPETVVGALAVDSQLRLLLKTTGESSRRQRLVFRLRASIVRLSHRLRTLQRADGGFWPLRNKTGGPSSTWMSAVAAGGLWRARDVVNTSQSVAKTLAFLRTAQNATDGCFEEAGPPYGFWLGGGLTRRREFHREVLTAAVLDQVAPVGGREVVAMTTAGRRCLESALRRRPVADWSTHSLALLARQAVRWWPRKKMTQSLITKLRLRGVSSDGGETSLWYSSTPPARPPLSWRWRLGMFDAETTGTAAMALVAAMGRDGVNVSAPAVAGVVRMQRRGRLFSAQDWLAALRARTELARSTGGGELRLRIVAEHKDGSVKEQEFDLRSRLTFTTEIRDMRRAKVEVKGAGCAYIWIFRRYTAA